MISYKTARAIEETEAPVYTVGLSKVLVTRLSAYGMLLFFLAAGAFSALTGHGEVSGASVLYVLIFFATIATHELVHGLFFRVFGGKPSYGAGVKYFFPYLYATSAGHTFRLSQTIIIALAPLLTVSGLSLIGALVVPAFGDYMAVIFITNTAGAIGDMWMTGRLARFRSFKDATVVDLSDGIAVYSQDSRAKEIASALYGRDTSLPIFFAQWLCATAAVVVAEILAVLIGPIFADKLVIGPPGFPLIMFTNTEQVSEFEINFGVPILAGLIFALATRLFSRHEAKSEMEA